MRGRAGMIGHSGRRIARFSGLSEVYFRFTAGLLLALLVSMAGIWLEKQTLELRRETSVQHYHEEILRGWLVRRCASRPASSGARRPRPYQPCARSCKVGSVVPAAGLSP
ncbi:MAG: hypothetical protein ACKPHU_17690, partial [Planctomycetaceae bacterium]